MNRFDEKSKPAAEEEDASPKGTPEESALEESVPEEHEVEEILSLLMSLSDKSEAADSDEDEEEDEEDDDEPKRAEDMVEEEYHQKSLMYSQRGRFTQAIRLCMKGLEQFPNSVDLLTDIISYSCAVGRMETAASHYRMLRAVPFLYWNWRAFSVCIDYMRELDPAGNEAECRELIDAYRTVFPYNEKAAFAESELEYALNHVDRSIEILQEALRRYPSAAHCSLWLAELEMERGDYEAVIDACSCGIASVEAKPTADVPYLLYLRTLAKDGLLHRRAREKQPIAKEEVEALAAEYELLQSKEFPGLLLKYRRTIRQRAKMLSFLQTA